MMFHMPQAFLRASSFDTSAASSIRRTICCSFSSKNRAIMSKRGTAGRLHNISLATGIAFGSSVVLSADMSLDEAEQGGAHTASRQNKISDTDSGSRLA